MANKRKPKNNRRSQKKQQPQPSARRKLASRAALDANARRYASLIADPCKGPLVEGVYPGAGGGVVSRFESDFLLAYGGTETATAVFFTPGFNSELVGGNGGGMLLTPTTAITSDSGTIAFQNSTGFAPGYTWLANNAKAFRSVAACIQVSWPGTELTRQGIVGLGQTTLSNCLGGTQNAGNLRVLANSVARMPDDTLELVLRPTEASQRWCDPTLSPTLAVVQEVWGDAPSLFLTASGFAGGTGIRVRVVNVVEWLPATATGIAGSVPRAPASNNTLTDVLHFLDTAMGNKWVRRAGGYALSYLTGGGSNLLQITR